MAWKSLTEEEISEKEEFDGEFWEPEKDDTLQGTVQLVKKGKYNKYFLIVQDEVGDEWITTQCATLHKQIKKLEIQEEDIVHLTYNGRADDEYQTHLYLLQKWIDEEDSE